MFGYDIEELRRVLSEVISANLGVEAAEWLNTQGDNQKVQAFNTAFAVMPRKTGRAQVVITTAQQQQLSAARKGFSVEGWSVDRLSRVWLLIKNDHADKDNYFRVIENLFLTGEMNELVALYSALPVLPYAELWVKRCAEGIRSNIGTVLEAIMYNNPYPAENLDEAAWNQLIMKAFFTDKDLSLIQGTEQRNNPELVRILTDYAKERWSAGREVNPALWQLAARYTGAEALSAMKEGQWNKLSAIGN